MIKGKALYIRLLPTKSSMNQHTFDANTYFNDKHSLGDVVEVEMADNKIRLVLTKDASRFIHIYRNEQCCFEVLDD